MRGTSTSKKEMNVHIEITGSEDQQRHVLDEDLEVVKMWMEIKHTEIERTIGENISNTNTKELGR